MENGVSEAEAIQTTTLPSGAFARRGMPQRRRLLLFVAGPAVILAVVAFFLITGGRSESTDDAYVQAARAAISTSVPGRVVEIDVAENRFVRKGQVLFRLDPTDYQVAAQEAAAALQEAREGVLRSQSVYQQRRADLATAQETARFAQRDAVRQKALASAGVSSRAQADEAAHAAAVAARQVVAATEEAAAARAEIGGRENVTMDRQAKVMRAQADLERARLNLGYTTVTAPVDGVVTKVEQLQVGNRVAPSQTLFWLVSGRPWIEANFKEDQVAHLRVGQPAKIEVAAYGHALRGRVASLSPGTGSSFALLPPENATGNWVKVVQRVPVRIALDGNAPGLAAGLSAKVTVDIRRGSARNASGS
jgi:membrane fusion protein (multidrug efflux system)